jgi:hypothetical protein
MIKLDFVQLLLTASMRLTPACFSPVSLAASCSSLEYTSRSRSASFPKPVGVASSGRILCLILPVSPKLLSSPERCRRIRLEYKKNLLPVAFPSPLYLIVVTELARSRYTAGRLPRAPPIRSSPRLFAQRCAHTSLHESARRRYWAQRPACWCCWCGRATRADLIRWP